MSAPRAHWYLVQTKPRQEQTARTNLARQGYETFLPLLRRQARRPGRAAARLEPLFPRYLFVHLEPEKDDFAPIRSTLGVTQLVRFGAAYAHVPDALIAELRARGGPAGIAELPAPEFRSGDRVRIVEGPLAGYEGIFGAARGRDRVTLLLEIASRQVAIELPPGVLGPA